MSDIEETDVAVVGAGIVGVCCALALQDEGREVLLIDRAGPGEGCSKGNAGHIAIEHVSPIATLATLRAVPGMLAQRNGPLSVHWPSLPGLMGWALRFALAARPGQVARGRAGLAALNAGAAAAFERLEARAGLTDLMRREGTLMVAEGRSALSGLRNEAEEAAEFGVRSRILTGEEVRELEPALSRELVGGVLYPDAGFVTDPHDVVRRVFDTVATGGGGYRQAEVTRLTQERGGWRISCAEGEIRARACLLAAGAFSGRLAAPLGYRVPLAAGRGYHYTAFDPSVEIRRPVGSADQRFLVTPMQMGLRIAGRLELGGLEAPMRESHAVKLLPLARRLLPGLAPGEHGLWMGHRPVLPDSLPVIDRAPHHPGLFFAFGHHHLGLTQAPVTARMIADLVAGRTPPIDAAPYRIDRF